MHYFFHVCIGVFGGAISSMVFAFSASGDLVTQDLAKEILRTSVCNWHRILLGICCGGIAENASPNMSKSSMFSLFLLVLIFFLDRWHSFVFFPVSNMHIICIYTTTVLFVKDVKSRVGSKRPSGRQDIWEKFEKKSFEAKSEEIVVGDKAFQGVQWLGFNIFELIGRSKATQDLQLQVACLRVKPKPEMHQQKAPQKHQKTVETEWNTRSLAFSLGRFCSSARF